jgi:hypothetical protein
MRRSIAAVLGSIVLTTSMVVWPSDDSTMATDGETKAKPAIGHCNGEEDEDGVWKPGFLICQLEDDTWVRWFWDGEGLIGEPIPEEDALNVSKVTGRFGAGTLELLSFFLGNERAAEFLILIVLLILHTGIDGAESTSCDEAFYHGTPTVKVKDAGSTGTPALGRAGFWVHEDCSVRVELVWQAPLIEGWCYILVATGDGTSSSRGSSPQYISGTLAGGTTAIDEPCPAVDCPGSLDLLLGGNTTAGQVGPYLSSTSAEMEGKIRDGTLDVAPLSFGTGHMIFKVKGFSAKPQEPPPEEELPADKACAHR